jgi:hypothetical protein
MSTVSHRLTSWPHRSGTHESTAPDAAVSSATAVTSRSVARYSSTPTAMCPRHDMT